MRKSGARETRLLLVHTLKRRRATTAEAGEWQGVRRRNFAARLWTTCNWPLRYAPSFTAKRMRSLAEFRGVHDCANSCHSVTARSGRCYQNSMWLRIHARHLIHVARQDRVRDQRLVPHHRPVRHEIDRLRNTQVAYAVPFPSPMGRRRCTVSCVGRVTLLAASKHREPHRRHQG